MLFLKTCIQDDLNDLQYCSNIRVGSTVVPGTINSTEVVVQMVIWRNTICTIIQYYIVRRPIRAPVPPVLSTCPLHTNSGCGKERQIQISDDRHRRHAANLATKTQPIFRSHTRWLLFPERKRLCEIENGGFSICNFSFSISHKSRPKGHFF